MKIILLNNQRKYKIDSTFCENVIKKFISINLKKYQNFKNLELFVSFVSTQKIRNLKKNLFDLDIITDVISVPIDAGSKIEATMPGIFGEIFICPEVASRQSKLYNISFNEEIALLIIHGMLHLIGYKDATDDEIKLMRSQEKKILNAIYKI